MDITLAPSTLQGALTVPPSKSHGHRVLIAAALAQGDSLIRHPAASQDMDATRRCLAELGAAFEDTADGLLVHGMGASPMWANARMALPHLDCGESGSTLRFLIPLALALRSGGVFTGSGRLMERPLAPYFDLFDQKGIFYELKEGVLTVQGRLEPGEYALPGNVSSQFFTGLLFALSMLDGPSVIRPTTPLESVGYIAMTCQVMERFGVQTLMAMSEPPQYHLSGGGGYRPQDVTLEGDWSQAGFWYAANALGGQVALQGLDPNSLQGDRAMAQYYDLLTKPGDVDIDVSQCPDLVPPLAVMAALRRGKTVLSNASRLRMKESDRLAAVAQALNALGAQVTEGDDFLAFEGVDALTGGRVDGCNDHRIVMMAAMAALKSTAPVTILGAQAVAKSYPDFWQVYETLGGKLKWNT